MDIPYEIQKEIYDFFEDLRLFGYNHDFTEFSCSRNKKNYENILRKLYSINLPNPLSLSYTTISLEELIRILNEIMLKIFGNNYKNRLNYYSSLITLEEIDNPFDAVTETNLVNGEQVPSKIYISNKCKSIQVVSTGHEYVHCLTSKYDIKGFNDKINNVHYKELLSIIVEYIVCYELSIILKTEQINEKHELLRIFHDKEQTIERNECLALKTLLSRLRDSRNLNITFLKKYITYQEHNSFTYILSDIYALYLLDIYKDNPNTLLNLLTSIIDGDRCINDLLSYYNLSLGNQKVTDKYDKVVDNVSKRLHL